MGLVVLEQVYFWDSATERDTNHQIDSTKAYDGEQSSHFFWEDWLGTARTSTYLVWVNPKLNWTPNDYYNYEDLNRVENNTKFVAELIRYFITLPSFEFVTNRDMKHIEFADSLNRIENMQNILRQRYTPSGWIINKTEWMPNDPFTFNDAKRLESNLALLYGYYKGNSELIPRCGMAICGEGGV